MTKGVFVVALSGLMLGSCTSGFEGFNTDPDSAQDIDQKTLITTMEMDAVIPCSDEGANAYQRACNLMGDSYSGYMAAISSFDNGGVNTTTYALDATDYNNVPFSVAFTDVMAAWLTLRYAYEAEQISEDTFAIAEVIKVFALQRATDIYGPLPVTHFGETENPYDSQETVYMSIFEDLNAAIEVLKEYATNSPDATPLSSVDIIYQGSYPKWLRLANSLKLRMAMRLSYVAPALAEQYVREALAEDAGGVIESNADNAQIPTQNNPFRVVMYDYNGGDSRVSADITSYMNGYKDPRRAKYFTESTFTGGIQNGYIGLRSGISIPTQSLLYSNMVVDYTTPLMWMNAAEVAFLKAEAALRGWYGSTADARTCYEEGVRLSFEQWGVSADYDAYIADATSLPASYVDPLGKESNTGETSSVTIKWDERGNFETNLEQIITQKWLAIYPEGFEAWCEFRRTGYPLLMPATNNRSGGVIPQGGYANRMPYPVEEYQENNEHINEAITLLGGPDNMATRLWWDCKVK